MPETHTFIPQLQEQIEEAGFCNIDAASVLEFFPEDDQTPGADILAATLGVSVPRTPNRPLHARVKAFCHEHGYRYTFESNGNLRILAPIQPS